MAVANIEISTIGFKDKQGFALRGSCLRSEALTVSGSTATLATGVTSTEANNGGEIYTISTDTDCYYASGTTPDPTALTATALTTARRLLSAGASSDHAIGVGDKVAVRAA